MIDSIAGYTITAVEYVVKAFGLIWVLVRNLAPPWSALILLGFIFLGTYFLSRKLIFKTRYGHIWIAAIIAVLFWLVIITGGKNV